MKILEIIKTNNLGSEYDLSVLKDTGSESFACLILQQALIESSLLHCIYNANENNPIYCSISPNIQQVIKGPGDERSYGVMQINTDVHEEVDVVNFQKNVGYGVNYLISLYKEKLSTYPDGLYFGTKHYKGWELALRYYNGWDPTGNTGNFDYVEDVIAKKAEILNLFPEYCK